MEEIKTMGEVYRMEEIDFKTNLSIDDVMYLTKLYIERQKDGYEIDETILYDTKLLAAGGTKAWCVYIVPLLMKKTFPDESLMLAIPDNDEWIVYLVDNHGFPVEKMNLLTGESVSLNRIINWRQPKKKIKGELC